MQFPHPEIRRISAKTDRGSQTAAVRRYFPIHQLIKILFGKLRRMSALRLSKTPRGAENLSPSYFERPQRRVTPGRGDFCSGRQDFPTQKAFPCSPRVREFAGFQRKSVRLSESSRFHRLMAQQNRVWFEFICIRYRKIVRKIVFGRLVAEVAEDAKPFISCGFGKGETASAQIKNFRRDARRGKDSPVRQLERLIRKRGSAPACPRCRNHAPPGRGTWPAPSPIPARAVRAGGPRRRPTTYP